MYSTFRVSKLSTSEDKDSNRRNASPRTIIQRYWIFMSVYSIPVTVRVMFKSRTNNRNSSGSPCLNKDILNWKRSDVLDVGSIQNFRLTKYFSDLASYVYLIRGIGGGSTCAWVIIKFHPFLWEILFMLSFLCVCLLQDNWFAKCHVPYVLVV